MEVQRDNEILVQKISRIIHNQTLPLSNKDEYLPNLSNVGSRRARLRRIEDENLVQTQPAACGCACGMAAPHTCGWVVLWPTGAAETH